MVYKVAKRPSARHDLELHQTLSLTSGRFVFTPSNHWGQRTPFDRCKVLWGSWAVFGPDNSGGSFWFGGDTAYCDSFEQIGRRLGPFDLAAIPIGNYRFLLKSCSLSGSLSPLNLLQPSRRYEVASRRSRRGSPDTFRSEKLPLSCDPLGHVQGKCHVSLLDC